jgi:hypothetical protein
LAGGALTAGAAAVGGTTGATDCTLVGAPARDGRNASASTPANATEDIHADTRLSVLSTDATDAILTCWSLAAILCVFPYRNISMSAAKMGLHSTTHA